MEATAIVFSDIHKGVDSEVVDNNQDLLNIFLDDLISKIAKKKLKPYDHIILNGDIIESWYAAVFKTLKTHKLGLDEMFSKFEQIAENKVYIIGNHCTTETNGELPDIISKYLISRGWYICRDFAIDRIYFAHGHRGEYSKATTFLASKAIRFVYFLSRFLAPVFGKLIDKIKNPIASWLDSKLKDAGDSANLKYYETVLKRHKNSGAYIFKVFGHTHLPMIVERIGVINTGDWMEHSTYCTIKVTDTELGATLNKVSYGKPVKVEELVSISSSLDF